MESYSVEAILSAVDKNFSSTMKSADSSMNSLDSSTRKTNTSILDVAKGIGVFKLVDSAIGVVKNSVDGAIDRFDTLNKYPVVMQALGYSADQVDNSMSKLNKGIDGLPTSLNEIVSNTQQLAISTGDLDKGTDTAIALNNAFLASGASTADASRGMQQYVQMLSKGTVDMQSWRSIQETMPIAMNKVAKSFKDQGVNSVNELYDALQDGTVTFEDFNNRLIKLNEGVGGFAELAKKNSAGIRTSFSNIKTAVVKGLANIMTAIDEGMQGAGLGTIAENFDKIKDAVNTAFKVIAENIPPAIDFLTQLWESLKKGLDGFDVTGFAKIFEIIANVAKVAFGAILAVLPTVVEWVGKLATFFSKVVTAIQPFLPALLPIIGAWASFMVHLKGVSTAIRLFNSLKTVVTGVTTTFKILTAVMAANPFVIIVGAIVGLVAAFIYFWNTSEEFRSFWIGLWESIKEIVHSSVEGIQNIWDGVSEWFSNLWNGIKDISDKVWTTIQNAPETAANFVQEKWSELTSFFANLWSDITQSASQAWENLKQSALNIVDGMVSSINNQWNNLKNTASSVWKAITDQVKSSLDFILKYIGPFVSNFSKVFSNIIDAVKSIFTEVKNIILNAFEIVKALIAAPLLFIIDLITGDFQQMKDDLDMIWKTLVESVQNIWLSIKNIFTVSISTIVNSALLLWAGFKQSVINVWTEVVYQATMLWNNIKYFFTNLWIDIKYSAIQMWIDLKYSIIGTWIEIKYKAIEIWDNLKQWFIQTIDNIVQTLLNSWTVLKQGTIDLFNNTIQGAKNAWSSFKTWIGNLITETIDNAIRGWENLKQGTIDLFNGLVDGAKRAWDNLVKSVQGLIDDVKGWFDKLREINLWEAGKAIMDSFLKGLKKAWKAVQDFVGGIGDWIRDHKGPIRVDRKLLIPAGNAIMEGLNNGLNKGFSTVQDNVSSMGDSLSTNFDIGSQLSNINGQIQTQVQHEVSYGTTNQPAQFNVRLGNREFSAFVEDISQAQGNEINLNMQF